MENEYKEVYFYEYCVKCKHKGLKEEDTPCDECLNEPVRQHSHKPVKFIEKD